MTKLRWCAGSWSKHCHAHRVLSAFSLHFLKTLEEFRSQTQQSFVSFVNDVQRVAAKFCEPAEHGGP